MGGPCRLKAPGKLNTAAPTSTDNFHIRPFVFDGVEFQSVEQAYQASKFTHTYVREALRKMLPTPGESDSEHGMRVWSEGQHHRCIRPDWNAVKVEIMLRACRAKYAQHADLQAALVSTLDVPLDGAPSTSWTTNAGGTESWTRWNGLIQMRLREELQPTGILPGLEQAFASFYESEGGAQLPLPDEDAPKRLVQLKGLLDKLQTAGSSSSSGDTQPAARSHVAGLWLGEASPAAELVPVNPIHWSLTRQPPAPRPASNAFGGGYFVNAESIPGSPELHFTIDGTWDVSSGAVTLTKRYVSHNIPEMMTVVYEGKLCSEADGSYILKGTWTNVVEETHGVFGCRLEPQG